MLNTILTSLSIGAMIVAAQSLWKQAISKAGENFNLDYIFSKKFFSFILSPYLLGGLIIYALATLLYFFALSKYPYSIVQTIVVSSSLIFTFASAHLLFHESITPKQILGLVILLLGVWLIVNK